ERVTIELLLLPHSHEPPAAVPPRLQLGDLRPPRLRFPRCPTQRLAPRTGAERGVGMHHELMHPRADLPPAREPADPARRPLSTADVRPRSTRRSGLRQHLFGLLRLFVLGRWERLVREDELAVLHVDGDLAAELELAEEELVGELLLHVGLDHTRQRTGAIVAV